MSDQPTDRLSLYLSLCSLIGLPSICLCENQIYIRKSLSCERMCLLFKCVCFVQFNLVFFYSFVFLGTAIILHTKSNNRPSIFNHTNECKWLIGVFMFTFIYIHLFVCSLIQRSMCAITSHGNLGKSYEADISSRCTKNKYNFFFKRSTPNLSIYI